MLYTVDLYNWSFSSFQQAYVRIYAKFESGFVVFFNTFEYLLSLKTE